MKKEKIYTDMEKLFLEALRDPTNKGNLRRCMDVAGYSENTSSSQIVRSLGQEMVQIANELLAAHSVQATMEIVGTMVNPGLNSKNVIAAAKEILDRAGVKKDSGDVKLNVGGGLVILPAKRPRVDDDEGEE